MNSFIVLSELAPPLLVVGVLLLLLAWPVSHLHRPLGRKLGALVVGTVGAFSFIALVSLSGPLPETGNWICSVCGACERQDRYCGVVLFDAQDQRSVSAETRSYAQWFARDVRLPHEHDWNAVGCHETGEEVRCAFGGVLTGRLFYASVPRVPDAEIARQLVGVLAAADADECLRLLDDFDRERERGPFMALALDAEPSREEFYAQFALWLVEHPLWRARGS